jgi:hypothetical protein
MVVVTGGWPEQRLLASKRYTQAEDFLLQNSHAF